MLCAQGFCKKYSSNAPLACDGITLQAERNEITVLLGPNGAGKSTLLKAFSGQHYATSGKIFVQGADGAVFDAAQFPERAKAAVGFVREVPALYDDWTVAEFLSMAASLRLQAETGSKPKTQAASQAQDAGQIPQTSCKPKNGAARVEYAVQKAVQFCDLREVLNKKISSLSHGYKQRLNFAQALIADPPILILDEPATGLDPAQIHQTRALVQSLKAGRAIVFSTHIIQEAETLADKIFIINGGRIVASGSPAQLIKASGKSNLEDAYLFFVGLGAASTDFGRPSNLRSPTDSAASTDLRLGSNFDTATRSTPANAAAPNDLSRPTASSTATSSMLKSSPDNLGLLRLAKKELFACAINPFYWICAALFCAFCAAAYFFGTRFFVQGQGSAALSPFFLLMPYISAVLIPAFCANIKSRAFDDSLPFRQLTKAAARVLACVAVFALCLLPTILVPACVSIFGNVDAGAVFVSYLALLFFAAASSSLCVFLSELLKNRAAFFAASVLALAAINAIHNALNFVPLGDFLSKTVRSISFAWRFDSASKGVLDTRDFCFFALLTLVFAFLSDFVCQARKGKKYFYKGGALRSWTIIFIFAFLALDSSRIYKRVDFSAQKNYSPAQRTINLLSLAQEKIRISYYRSPELLKLYPQVRDVGDFLRSLSLCCGNVVYAELDADKAAAQKNLRDLNVPPFQIQMQKNNSMEFVDSYSTIVIDYEDKTLFIPAAFSAFGLEYDLNLRLDYLLNKKSRKAYVLCANGMSLQKDFKAALDWLNIEGFEIFPLKAGALLDASLDPQIPLALFGSAAASQSDAQALQDFLESGGSLFAALSPYSANVDGDWSLAKNKRDFVLPLLERRGLSFLDSIAADVSCVRANFRSAQDGGQEQNASVNYPLWINVFPQEAAPYGAAFFWASPLAVDNAKAEPLLLSSAASWRFLPNKKNPALLFDTNPFTVPKAAIADPLAQKERSVLAAQTLDKKIIAVSGELFANDLLLSLSGGQSGDFRNLNFLTTSLLNLMGEPDMAALKNKGGADFSLWKISDLAQWNRAKNFCLFANFVFAPIAIFALAAIFFARRSARSKLFETKASSQWGVAK